MLSSGTVRFLTSHQRKEFQNKTERTHGFIDKIERSSTFEENLGDVKSRTTDTHTHNL